MTRRRSTTLAALIAASGFAQTPRPAIDDPEARLTADFGPAVSELVVGSGPAWRNITQGQRTAHILSVPYTFPPGLDWSQTRPEIYSDKSAALILPPVLSSESLARV